MLEYSRWDNYTVQGTVTIGHNRPESYTRT